MVIFYKYFKGFESLTTTLTVAFAQGKNIPRVNIPRRGPPIIPKMPSAAWKKTIGIVKVKIMVP